MPRRRSRSRLGEGTLREVTRVSTRDIRGRARGGRIPLAPRLSARDGPGRRASPESPARRRSPLRESAWGPQPGSRRSGPAPAGTLVEDGLAEPQSRPISTPGSTTGPRSAIACTPHVGEEQRAPHRRATDDAAARHQRVDRHAAPAIVVEHELGRRQLLLVGPDRPVAVVQVELGRDVTSAPCSPPSTHRRADVAPVGLACSC